LTFRFEVSRPVTAGDPGGLKKYFISNTPRGGLHVFAVDTRDTVATFMVHLAGDIFHESAAAGIRSPCRKIPAGSSTIASMTLIMVLRRWLTELISQRACSSFWLMYFFFVSAVASSPP